MNSWGIMRHQVVRLSPARREVHISVVPGTQAPTVGA
jgi:hypothetical protein